jgi:hypothetical protein
MSHGRPNRTRDIGFFYPTAHYTGYDEPKSDRRFSVLHGVPELGSSNLLDIGSGPCNLLGWLRRNKYETHYEAVDIREDSLRLCPCAHTHTHTGAPAHTHTGARWDIVCLFGTVTFNIGSDQGANRKSMGDLLSNARSLLPKHIVFTAIRNDRIHGLDAVQLIGYSKEEVSELAAALSPDSWEIHEEPDPYEWIVRCSFTTR